jgi:hypothetical protein
MAKARDYINNVVEPITVTIPAGQLVSEIVDLKGAAPAKVFIPGTVANAAEMRFQFGLFNEQTNGIDFYKVVDFSGTDIGQQIESSIAFVPNPPTFFGVQYLRFTIDVIEPVDLEIVVLPRSI